MPRLHHDLTCGPPHFHAIYGDFEVTVEIESGKVNGEFPRRPLSQAFKRFRLDPELRTLVWVNGADFSPEFLHEKVRVAA